MAISIPSSLRCWRSRRTTSGGFADCFAVDEDVAGGDFSFDDGGVGVEFEDVAVVDEFDGVGVESHFYGEVAVGS